MKRRYPDHVDDTDQYGYLLSEELCPNPAEVTELGHVGRKFVCGCPPNTWPVSLIKTDKPVRRELNFDFMDANDFVDAYTNPEIIASDFSSLYVKKISYVTPVSPGIVADAEHAGEDGPTPRKFAWSGRLYRRYMLYRKWYNFREALGSWILPWDPYED